jgi:hypothetical protein
MCSPSSSHSVPVYPDSLSPEEDIGSGLHGTTLSRKVCEEIGWLRASHC